MLLNDFHHYHHVIIRNHPHMVMMIICVLKFDIVDDNLCLIIDHDDLCLIMMRIIYDDHQGSYD